MRETNRTHTRRSVTRRFAVLIIMALLVTIVFGVHGGQQSDPVLFDPVDSLYQRLSSYFYRPELIDDQEVLYGAMRGAVESLGDPLTEFWDPDRKRQMDETYSEDRAGIGVSLSMDDGLLKVIDSIAGMPAAIAGIQAGDQILAIDGRTTGGFTLNEATFMISGEMGDPVTLTVRHEDGSLEDIAVVRDVALFSPVIGEVLEDGAVAYIMIQQFGSDTARELDGVLNTLDIASRTGMILDLRNNSGGLMSEVVSAANRFVDAGIIMRTMDRLSGEKKYYSRGNSIPNLPLAVLVNESTASGAEIMAAAIRDNEAGVLVGQRTNGTGTFQMLIDFPDGSVLKVTVGEFFTPAGNPIQAVGLNPSILVTAKRTAEDDPYMTAALAWIMEAGEE